MTSYKEVKASWQLSEERLGFAAGAQIAQQLVVDGRIPTEDCDAAARFIDHYPMRDHVYDGARDTVEGLLAAGAQVTFWTQGQPKHQLYKVVSSGLLDIRREHPEWKKHLLAYAHEDKVGELENYLPTLITEATKKIVFVDDKSKNIIGIREKVAELKSKKAISEDAVIETIWINQGRTKDQVPEGYTLERFKSEFRTIDDIRELTPEGLINTGDTHYLLDWDHTMANTAEWRKDAQEKLATLYSREPIIGRFRDASLGLEQVSIGERYTAGMSGSAVFCVESNDGGKRVIKHGGMEHEKILREMRGFYVLANSPLSDHMLSVDPRHANRGVLQVEYFNGVQMRTAIKNDDIHPELAASIFAELLDIKTKWWGDQKKQGATGENSMQRQEWGDTLRRLRETVLPQLEIHGVDWRSTFPIRVNGREHTVDMCAMIDDVNSFLLEDVPYTVVAHNDATGGNMLVDRERGQWRIFDYEWAGLNDPAESYARMIKQVTTSTVSHFNLGNSNDVLEYGVSDIAQQLQMLGLVHIENMQEALADSAFEQRVRRYLVGSYLREAALSAERGGLPVALFAFAQASDIVEPVNV